MSAARWRELSTGPLAMLFLTFPGIFLPLDMIFAGPGIMAYATWTQAARVFLYSTALALLMSVIVCLIVAWAPARGRFALVSCLTLSAFALLHSLLLWSQYFTYSLEHQWVRQAAVVVLSLAAGPVLAWLVRERQLASLHSVMRASAALMAVAALGCAALVAAIPGEERAPPAAGAQKGPHGPPIFLITVDALSAIYLPM
jgi:hypothetical protein